MSAKRLLFSIALTICVIYDAYNACYRFDIYLATRILTVSPHDLFFLLLDEEEPEERLESSQNRRLIMTRVRTRWHFSRLLLLFSSSEALQARHCLTLLLLGLTSLRTALSCDEKTRPQSRDLSALPRYLEIRRYSERRDLDAPRVIPEWMQRENEASSMAGQSASDVASDDHSSDSLKIQRNCDGSDPSVTERLTYFDDDIIASRINGQRDYPRRKSDDRLSNPAKTRQVRKGRHFQNMKQREESARNWLRNLVRKRRGMPTLQVTSHYTVNQAVNQVQFRDSDNEASLTILDGPRQSASHLPETSVHDRDAEDALIEVPIDRLHSRKAPSVSHLMQPARSRRDLNGVSLEAERAGLNADNLFAETLVNRANERTSDYSAHQSSRGSQTLSQPSERNIDVAAQHRDDFADDRSDRGIVGFWVAGQTHLNRRNIYALDNRGDGARESPESSADRLRESDGIVINDVRNEFANANTSDSDVNVIAIDAVGDDFDAGTVSMENQVELDGISEIENRTDVDADVDSSVDLEGAEIRSANCGNVACSKSNDDLSVIRIKKFGEEEESNEDQEYEDEDRFTRVGTISTAPGNGTDSDIDSEAPFTGFEGSQKFPVKINHKSVPSQAEKFDRRHFGPHKEDVLEETSTWYPSTVLPDLPKSPSRDVLPRKTNDGSDDVVDEVDNRSEETTEMDATWNDTYDESWLPGNEVPEGPLSEIKSSLDEKFAVTSNIADSEFENATREKNDSKTEIDVAISSARPIEKINITILGLFEMTHGPVARSEGSSELEAAKLAVERVNKLDILKRFRLRLIYNDTKVSQLVKYSYSNLARKKMCFIVKHVSTVIK